MGRLLGMRILCVYAHPDDESFGQAHALAKYAREGAVIHGLFFTRGQQGQPTLDPPPTTDEMGRLREVDLREAAGLIGFQGIEVLEYMDGALDEAPADELEGHVERAMRARRADVVLTFGPGGITGHPDHVAVHRATTAVFHRLRQEPQGPRALFYDGVPTEQAVEMGLLDVPDGNPNTFVEIAETFPVKREALRCHARHVTDAVDMVARLEQEPQSVATLYRAWPPVAEGRTLSVLLPEA